MTVFLKLPPKGGRGPSMTKLTTKVQFSSKLLVFSLVQRNKNETRAQNLGHTCTWKSIINLSKSHRLPTLTYMAHRGRSICWVGLVGWLVSWLLEQFVNLSFSSVIFLGITCVVIVSPSCEEWGPGGREGEWAKCI
jgi:hypothetical protein